ncbi:phenylacetate--CoA ligase [Winogradskya consettensis]|uniref:Phenylacetate-coenzyme A ligase n=1 Tax=Winogradskya consettensis TaxID=113560 RepID=A0A919VZN7_9ACTN|nr:phenylacetate--CoA ligase family protein [Actinoplanes consettensis]GIM82278.1 phenylacetate-coenzyme A ligase [Actinoplanes consettensis]
MWWNDPSARAAFDTADRQRAQLEADGFAPATVARIQRQKLAELWDRAAAVPYYRDLPGFAARDLATLPVTGKDVVKARPMDFCPPGLTGTLKYYESSGSTGNPTPTPRLARDVIANVIGVSPLWRRLLGTEPAGIVSMLPSDVVPVGDFAAAACEYLGHQLLRAYPFSTGMCDFDRLAALFTGFRPRAVFAAPGVLSQWTRLLKTRGTLSDVRASVGTILLLGEVCLAGQRAKLARDWDADVFDVSYGSTETGTIAAACEHGSMHLLEHGHIVEIRDSDGTVGPAAPGAGGELVTTTLNNVARPLLRYGTGDHVDVAAEPCRCGLPLPSIAVRGRATDQVSLHGQVLTEQRVGTVVYDDHRLTGYLIQLRADGGRGRLVLERDVDVTDPDEDLITAAAKRFTEAGIDWDDIVVVHQLPATSKSGGSQKNWKRTNLVTVS